MQDSKKVDSLESTVREIGTDLVRIKSSVQELKQTIQSALKVIDGVRLLLEEKDILTDEELDEKLQFMKEEAVSFDIENPSNLATDLRKLLIN